MGMSQASKLGLIHVSHDRRISTRNGDLLSPFIYFAGIRMISWL